MRHGVSRMIYLYTVRCSFVLVRFGYFFPRLAKEYESTTRKELYPRGHVSAGLLGSVVLDSLVFK